MKISNVMKIVIVLPEKVKSCNLNKKCKAHFETEDMGNKSVNCGIKGRL